MGGKLLSNGIDASHIENKGVRRQQQEKERRMGRSVEATYCFVLCFCIATVGPTILLVGIGAPLGLSADPPDETSSRQIGQKVSSEKRPEQPPVA